MTCGAKGAKKKTRDWRVAAAFATTSSVVVFSDGSQPELRRSVVTASMERRLAEKWTLHIGGGASHDGELEFGGVRHALSHGPVVLASVSYRLAAGPPWLLIAGSASFATTATASSREQARLTACDARASFTLGTTLGKAIAPYAALRAFAGPVFWRHRGEAVLGSDRYHLQLAAGILATTRWLDAFVEIAPVGERSVTVGVAASFSSLRSRPGPSKPVRASLSEKAL